MKSILFALIFFGSLLFVCVAKADGSNMTLETELMATLNSFAKQHSLTGGELEKMLGKIVLDDKKMKKGGVGVIDKNTFILLNEKRNALMVSGHKWEGEESNRQEIVLTDGQHILGSLDGIDLSKISIVIFTPLEVRYINLANSIAGKYSR